MKSIEIVNLLLEADYSAADGSGVYMFGPRLAKEGSYSKDFVEAVKRLRQLNIVPHGTPDSSRLLDKLVDQGYVFIFKHNPGNVEVIGRHLPVRTTTEGADKAMQALGLNNHVAVAYRKHSEDSPKRLQVDQVLYGSKELDEPSRKQSVKKSEPATKGADMRPINAPFTIGITFDLRSKNGIKVVEVHPGGPAAQAGIQAGDIIGGTGEFYSKDGSTVGPYRIDTVKDLENTLKMTGGRYAVPFRIIHGSIEKFIPLLPQTKGKSGASGAGAVTVTPSMTDTQKNTYQPNELNPTRETGNLSANVSALT